MIIVLSFFSGVFLTLTWAAHALEAKRTAMFLVMAICCILGAILVKGIN